MAKDITVTMTQEEFDLLEEKFGIGSTGKWLRETLDHKIDMRVNQSILDLTAYNPLKLSKADKLDKLKDVTLPVRDDEVI